MKRNKLKVLFAVLAAGLSAELCAQEHLEAFVEKCEKTSNVKVLRVTSAKLNTETVHVTFNNKKLRSELLQAFEKDKHKAELASMTSSKSHATPLLGVFPKGNEKVIYKFSDMSEDQSSVSMDIYVVGENFTVDDARFLGIAPMLKESSYNREMARLRSEEYDNVVQQMLQRQKEEMEKMAQEEQRKVRDEMQRMNEDMQKQQQEYKRQMEAETQQKVAEALKQAEEQRQKMEEYRKGLEQQSRQKALEAQKYSEEFQAQVLQRAQEAQELARKRQQETVARAQEAQELARKRQQEIVARAQEAQELARKRQQETMARAQEARLHAHETQMQFHEAQRLVREQGYADPELISGLEQQQKDMKKLARQLKKQNRKLREQKGRAQ